MGALVLFEMESLGMTRGELVVETRSHHSVGTRSWLGRVPQGHCRTSAGPGVETKRGQAPELRGRKLRDLGPSQDVRAGRNGEQEMKSWGRLD